VPVVIESSSNQVGRTIGYGIGFVNSGRTGSGALKPLEKTGYLREVPALPGDLSDRAHCLEPETSILRVARNLLLILLVVLALPYLVTPLYRAGHPVSALMAWRYLTGAPMSRQWIDFSAISPWLPASVVAAEDAHFCRHHGVDWGALREAIDDAQEGEPLRGASTITQQVAKNLFLWPLPGPIRKLLEFPLALWIDLVLPKQRILEIYLNIAELGPSGQFGAQAGSLYAFGHPASALSAREAALLASILPNPIRRSARNPGSGVRRLAGIHMARAQAPGLPRCWSENRAF
jgi:monofunctional biosynthetic peptidoglycan transglycosylase